MTRALAGTATRLESINDISGTLPDIEGKAKDSINTRFNLESIGIQPEFHAIPTSNGNDAFCTSCYSMSKEEKCALCEFLIDLKVLDGYSSYISLRLGLI